MTEPTEKSATEGVEPLDGDESRSISKSLVKGLAILASFTSERPVLGISELAAQLGASRSTTHRYACTLVELGYLEQDSKRRYRLGFRAADIGITALNSIDLRTQALPFLEELRNKSSQTVTLAILDGLEVICVEVLGGYRARAREIAVPIRYGARLPAHRTATGKVLLAMLDPSERARALAQIKLAKRTGANVTSKRALAAELEEVSRTQLATACEELHDGLCSLAAPVFDAQGEAVAAVGVIASSERWTAERLRGALGEPLSDVASRISARARHPHADAARRPVRPRRRGSARRRR